MPNRLSVTLWRKKEREKKKKMMMIMKKAGVNRVNGDKGVRFVVLFFDGLHGDGGGTPYITDCSVNCFQTFCIIC